MKPFTSKHCTPINYGSPLNQSTFGLNEKQQEIMHKGRKKVKKLAAKYDEEIMQTGGPESKKSQRISNREHRVRKRYIKKIETAK